MKPQEVAEYLGITTRTLHLWARNGIGPRPIRIGGNSIRYRPADVEAYLQERTQGTDSRVSAR